MSLKSNVRKITPYFLAASYRFLRNFCNYSILGAQHEKRESKFFHDEILRRFPNLKPLPKSKVLDLGANVGNFTDVFVNYDCEVVALEPHEKAFRRLNKRFKNNSNVTLLNCAVSNKSGFTELHLHPDHRFDKMGSSIYASTVPTQYESKHDVYKVNTKALSEIIETYGPFFLVKIDIEGAESDLVETLISLADKITFLLMETHSRYMQTTPEYQKNIDILSEFILRVGKNDSWKLDWV